MKVGDIIYINGKKPAIIKKFFLLENKVLVAFGVSCKYKTSISNIYKEGDKLILKSEIFTF